MIVDWPAGRAGEEEGVVRLFGGGRGGWAGHAGLGCDANAGRGPGRCVSVSGVWGLGLGSKV